MYFKNPHHINRGHRYKLFKPCCRTNVIQNLFSHQVIDPCTNLLDDSFSATHLTTSDHLIPIMTSYFTSFCTVFLLYILYLKKV